MLNVTDLGEGSAILWVHGFPLASSVFENQLAIRRVRHVMPDLPGFGQSRPLGGEVALDAYAKCMIELLDQRGIDDAVFAGLSMGGYVCFAAARLAPKRMRGLILLDTRETADTDEQRQNRYDMIAKVQETRSVRSIVDAMLPKMLTPAAPRDMRDRVREIMSSSSPDGAVAALRAMAERPSFASLLPEIHVPTLIIAGEQDPITPPTEAERMAKAIRGAKLVRINGAAHLANYEKSAEVNRAITAFVTGIGSGR
jgi:pimeloyl-ACP methyl ester carboxylesterase